MKTNVPVVFAIWLAGLGAAGQYAKVSVVFDQMSEHYPDAGVALGFLVSLVGFVGIAFGVVAGLLVARIRFRRAMLWSLWAGAIISALEATLPPLSLMLALRGLEGVSHLLIVVAAPTLIAQLSASGHRGFTLSLWSTFFSVAFSLLVWLGIPLANTHGVPALFLAHALWMAALAIVLTWLLPQSEAPVPPARLRLTDIVKQHAKIYQSPFVSAPGIGWFFYTFCFLALLTFLPAFIVPESRSFVIGTMPLIAIATSMTLGVWLLRLMPAIRVVQTGFVLSVLCLFWLYALPGDPPAAFALAGTLGLVQSASFAAVPQLNTTAETQAQANGAMAQAGNLGNTLGTPVMLIIIGYTGYPGMIWTAILVMIVGTLVHAALAAQRHRVVP